MKNPCVLLLQNLLRQLRTPQNEVQHKQNVDEHRQAEE
jgi:hypothetical protein